MTSDLCGISVGLRVVGIALSGTAIALAFMTRRLIISNRERRLRALAERLLVVHEHRTPDTAAAIVDSVLDPKRP